MFTKDKLSQRQQKLFEALQTFSIEELKGINSKVQEILDDKIRRSLIAKECWKKSTKLQDRMLPETRERYGISASLGLEYE